MLLGLAVHSVSKRGRGELAQAGKLRTSWGVEVVSVPDRRQLEWHVEGDVVTSGRGGVVGACIRLGGLGSAGRWKRCLDPRHGVAVVCGRQRR